MDFNGDVEDRETLFSLEIEAALSCVMRSSI